MPSLSSPVRPSARRDRRSADGRIPLRRSFVDDSADPADSADPGAPEVAPPVVPWLLAALGGGFLAAASGWVVVVGITVLGWLTGGIGPLAGAIRLGTQLWLLANGGGAQVGGSRWTLIPLGVTAAYAVVLAQVAGFAAKQAEASRLILRGADGLSPAAARQIVRWVVVLVSPVYVAAVTVVALAVGASGQAVRAFVVAAVLSVAASTYGAARALRVDLTTRWPPWLRSVPRAVGASVCVVALGGCAVVVVALAQQVDQVSAITGSLQVSAAAGVVLGLLQLAFWPNVVAWGASWALGAGFTLGDGSLVSPRETDLGLLPSVPVFGALPPEGAGSWPVLAWLGVGVVAGVVGASIVVRSRPAGRFDETCLVGGLSGVVSGLVVVGLAALSGGDLGSGRLTGMGPRLLELSVMAVTLLGLSGMVAGLGWGLVRRPGPARTSPADVRVDPDEPTTDLGRPAGDEPTADRGPR